jgi:hypothetical protein
MFRSICHHTLQCDADLKTAVLRRCSEHCYMMGCFAGRRVHFKFGFAALRRRAPATTSYLLSSGSRTRRGGQNPLRLEAGGVLCRWWFCGRGRQTAHRNVWCSRRRAHNDYRESSHFSSSPSLRHPSFRSDGIEVVTGGLQAATAATFPLRVISS